MLQVAFPPRPAPGAKMGPPDLSLRRRLRTLPVLVRLYWYAYLTNYKAQIHYSTGPSAFVQSNFFGLAQPLKLSSAEGQMLPSRQHCGPAQTTFVPGHLTVASTWQCLAPGGGAGGPGPGPLHASFTHLSHSGPSMM